MAPSKKSLLEAAALARHIVLSVGIKMEVDLPDPSVSLASLLELVQQTGILARGVLESLVAVRKGRARVVFVAHDAEPFAIVQQLVDLCREKNIVCITDLDRVALGAKSGLEVPAAAVTIVDAGAAAMALDAVLALSETKETYTVRSVQLAVKHSFESRGLDEAPQTLASRLTRVSAALQPLVDSTSPATSGQEDGATVDQIGAVVGEVIALVASISTRYELDMGEQVMKYLQRETT